MHQLPSIREASAVLNKPSMDLEPNLYYILGLMNVNGNIKHSIQTHEWFVQPCAL